MFHTLFNLGMTCLLFPFSEKLVALSGFLVRKKKNEQEEPAQEETEEDGNIRNIAKRLDRRILSTPSLALETVSGEIVRMPAATDLLRNGQTPESILTDILGEYGFRILEKVPASYRCDCSRERVTRALIAMVLS